MARWYSQKDITLSVDVVVVINVSIAPLNLLTKKVAKRQEMITNDKKR